MPWLIALALVAIMAGLTQRALPNAWPQVVVEIADTEQNIQRLLPIIDEMVIDGLVTLERVHVISYRVPDSLLLEIFTNEGTGTLVVDDIAALSPEEQASGEAGA